MKKVLNITITLGFFFCIYHSKKLFIIYKAEFENKTIQLWYGGAQRVVWVASTSGHNHHKREKKSKYNLQVKSNL